MKMEKGFTLLELIIIIIIVGILATLGFTTYTNQIEYSRTAEARAKISFMRKLAYEYYLKNGSIDSMTSSDLGMNTACQSTDYFSYWYTTGYGYQIGARRCTSGGKSPNSARVYLFGIVIGADVSGSVWHCRYNDGASEACFGYPSW
jgi:prepilin-type N-terminal cleavage/methylation domain-containing protein